MELGWAGLGWVTSARGQLCGAAFEPSCVYGSEQQQRKGSCQPTPWRPPPLHVSQREARHPHLGHNILGLHRRSQQGPGPGVSHASQSARAAGAWPLVEAAAAPNALVGTQGAVLGGCLGCRAAV